jgi:hypothetical protein
MLSKKNHVSEFILQKYSFVQISRLHVLAFNGIAQKISGCITKISTPRKNIELVERDDNEYVVSSKSGFRCCFGNYESTFTKTNTCHVYDIIVLDMNDYPKNIIQLISLLYSNGYADTNTYFVSIHNKINKRIIKVMKHSNLKKVLYDSPKKNRFSVTSTSFWKLRSKKLRF